MFPNERTTELLPLRTVLWRGAVVLIVVLLLSYVAYQARYLIQGPAIELTSEPDIVQSDRFVMLEGTARNIARITLNGRQIFTDETGQFREALVLENGYTIATLTAYDRYGRATNLARPFVYRPASLITE